jgi:hypothetical protein
LFSIGHHLAGVDLVNQLTAFAFAADPKNQRNGFPVARAFAPTSVDARTELKEDERERRNTAGCVIGGFRAKKTAQTTGPIAPVEITGCAPVAHGHQ